MERVKSFWVYLGRCQVSEMRPIVGIAECIIPLMWRPLDCHAYLSKSGFVALFWCAWSFDGYNALIINCCRVPTAMPCILKQNCCYRFYLSEYDHLVDTMNYTYNL